MKSPKSKVQSQRISAAVSLLVVAMLLASCAGQQKEKKFETAKVVRGELAAHIPSSGIVTPRNRLEIKPPFAGRIENVIAREGKRVGKGEILAWIGSNDRAALLDAARSKGEAELKHWEDVYKPAPVIAPIDGFIILSNYEPGQSFAMTDPILVMADKLIVKAQVDETDIGKISAGQKATIILDAYPDQKTEAAVESIEYESQVINNVTVYQVYVLPEAVPDYFRSGMSATVNFALESQHNVLMLPLRAVRKQNGRSYVFVKGKDGGLEPRQVTTGLDNNLEVELRDGVLEGDEVAIPDAATAAKLLSQRRGGSGPFNPFGGRRSR